MEVGVWILLYLITVIFWLWVLKWGGSDYLVGWKAWGLLGWFTGHWDAKQIEFYAFILLVIESIWFIAGLFSPVARLASIGY